MTCRTALLSGPDVRRASGLQSSFSNMCHYVHGTHDFGKCAGLGMSSFRPSSWDVDLDLVNLQGACHPLDAYPASAPARKLLPAMFGLLCRFRELKTRARQSENLQMPYATFASSSVPCAGKQGTDPCGLEVLETFRML